MPDFCLPAIDPRDYEAFRRIAGSDLPYTYDEWRKLQTKERDSFIMRGHKVIEIDIHPDEFADYCRTNSRGTYNERLRDLALEKCQR